MPGSGQNEVISIKISVPLANAIEEALYVDGISLHGISLPETSLHCTQAPRFLKCLFTILPEGQISGSCTNSTVYFTVVSAHFFRFSFAFGFFF